jgi:hypothetical protein
MILWINELWWWFFALELWIYYITCIMWILYSDDYIRGSLATSSTIAKVCRPLLWEQANIMCCMYCLFMGFLLYTDPYDRMERIRTFTWLAISMTVNDILTAMITLLSWRSLVSHDIMMPKLLVSTTFGIIRSQYILANHIYI